MGNWLRLALVSAAGSLLLAGCASTRNDPKDPLEGFNRAMHSFNRGLDDAVLEPVARGYQKVTPAPVNYGVSNFFSNLGDAYIGANNLLQGKAERSASDVGRVLLNTTVGIFGLFDVASDMGMTKHDEDFGQTLGVWGVGEGPYVVLPVFGPKTLRGVGGLVVDSHFDPILSIDHVRTRNTFLALRFVDQRADLLEIGDLVDEASFDRYRYERDTYLQFRRNRVRDGAPTAINYDD